MASFILIICISLWSHVMSVQKWDQYELTIKGPSSGNPFVDTELFADFSNNDQTFHVRGFYDGEGIYKVRFMPIAIGLWTYVTSSNIDSMNNVKGSFNATSPTGNNRGPIVADRSNNKSFIYLETKESFFQTGMTVPLALM